MNEIIKSKSNLINELELYYEVKGQGESLLLVHGFAGCGADWQYFGNNWTSGYQAIIPDLRGHGRSTNPLAIYTHQLAALDLYALLDQLNIKKFKAIGISGGGNVF